MVTQVVIKDNTKTTRSWTKDLEIFQNGKVFEFKPYINIVVGPNGSGKSTLLKLISDMMLCDHTMYSSVPADFKDLNLFNIIRDKGNMFLNGAEVKADYCGICFRFKPISEYNNEDANAKVENLALFVDSQHASIGQQTVKALHALFNQMFGNKVDIQFPMNALKALFKNGNVNNIWKENYEQMLQYYHDNQVLPKEEDFQYTVLLDEPDRNLDIDNIEEVYSVLSTQKDMTQIIAVVHNPILIYRLSKLPYINFIEMQPGYIEKIKNFVEKQ